MDRIVDLTLPLRHGMRGVEFEAKFTFERDGWNARTLHLYSHAGTHIDAPVHFEAGIDTVDGLPLERCMGPAWVVDLDGIAPRAVIGVRDLGPVESDLARGDCLLLRTGWSRHVEIQELYRASLPRVGEELARWCVARGVKLLGVEPPSVADVLNREEVTLVHRILLEGGIVIVEGLARLDALSKARVFFMALPLPIDSGDGSPCRALAVESDWPPWQSDRGQTDARLIHGIRYGGDKPLYGP
jgi:kynurenine formamidase